MKRKRDKKRSIDFVSYVCDPREIVVEANRSLDSAYLKVELKVADKVALIGRYKIGFVDDIEIIHEKVKTFCDAAIKFSDNEIQYHIITERVSLALNAKKSLKEVRAKSGRLIWRR